MPVPTQYSEAILADYMVSVLGPLADVLGWTGGSPQVQEAVADALLDLGVTSIAAVTSATDIRGLRALSRRAIWKAVADATASFYAFTDVAAQKFNREQIHDHAVERQKEAEAECRSVGVDPAYSVQIVSISRPHDPYIVLEDSARTLP